LQSSLQQTAFGAPAPHGLPSGTHAPVPQKPPEHARSPQHPTSGRHAAPSATHPLQCPPAPPSVSGVQSLPQHGSPASLTTQVIPSTTHAAFDGAASGGATCSGPSKSPASVGGVSPVPVPVPVVTGLPASPRTNPPASQRVPASTEVRPSGKVAPALPQPADIPPKAAPARSSESFARYLERMVISVGPVRVGATPKWDVHVPRRKLPLPLSHEMPVPSSRPCALRRGGLQLVLAPRSATR